MIETIIQSSLHGVLTNYVENVHLVFAVVDIKPFFLQGLAADASSLSRQVMSAVTLSHLVLFASSAWQFSDLTEKTLSVHFCIIVLWNLFSGILVSVQVVALHFWGFFEVILTAVTHR